MREREVKKITPREKNGESEGEGEAGKEREKKERLKEREKSVANIERQTIGRKEIEEQKKQEGQ